MARYVDLHPDNPQPRLIAQVVAAIRDEDALIAYPTDSGYALGGRVGSKDIKERILAIRELDDRHHFDPRRPRDPARRQDRRRRPAAGRVRHRQDRPART